MNAKQYMSGLTLTTQAALKSGEMTLPEIIGCLEITKLNAERQAYQRAMAAKEAVIQPAFITPPDPPADAGK